MKFQCVEQKPVAPFVLHFFTQPSVMGGNYKKRKALFPPSFLVLEQEVGFPSDI